MPAGMPYFAWVDPTETTFQAGHLRWDEQVFSFTLSQEEGDPASLTIVVRRPRNVAGDPIGLLGPGRKIWAWFALDCGPALIKFRGRLVGIPTSIFEELVTLEFVARPVDVVAQKEALANTLRVLPFYDAAVVDPQRRSDPDIVLEGYTKVWHYDRETHVITVSDEISGEDGTIDFDGVSDTGKVLFDGLGLTLTSGPLSRVDLNAEYAWTQRARGTVDLGGYLVSNWPYVANGAIRLNASDWPKSGTGIGDGWTVAESSAVDLHDYTVKTKTENTSHTIHWPDGDTSSQNFSHTFSYLGWPPYSSEAGAFVTKDEWRAEYDQDPDGTLFLTSFNRNTQAVRTVVMVQEIKPTLMAAYSAERQCTERVSLTLFANMQHILTDPEDGEALRIDDIRSVNLSEMIDSEMPIGDSRRRSYIATQRGNRSLEHLIVLARAHLMKRARVVEITFAPKLSRMPEITLRKNISLLEPRVGQALGKVIGYSIALDGADGRINCEVRIGCTIGRGGTATATAGIPTYCSINYVGEDYQQFVGRTVVFTVDSSVGYQPPNADPNDDGINFLSGLTVYDVLESGLAVTFGPEPGEQVEQEQNAWNASSGAGVSEGDNNMDRLVAARSEWTKNTMLAQYETRATFKLKSMTREFSTDYQLQVTDLQIPVGYNLEAT
jgi:hypothetical protein